MQKHFSPKIIIGHIEKRRNGAQEKHINRLYGLGRGHQTPRRPESPQETRSELSGESIIHGSLIFQSLTLEKTHFFR